MQAVTHACILLRWRIVWQHVMLAKPVDEIARMLFVSDRTVHRYAERFLVTGHVHPFERRNGCYCKLSDDDQLLVLELNFVPSWDIPEGATGRVAESAWNCSACINYMSYN